MGDPASQSSDPRPAGSASWFGWILCTTIFPAVLGAWFVRYLQASSTMLPVLVLTSIAVLICHIVASVKLSAGRSGVIVPLILGGWALIAVTFFASCLLNLNLRL
jgi:hypothetical protein